MARGEFGFEIISPFDDGEQAEATHLAVAERYERLTDWMAQETQRYDQLQAVKTYFQNRLDSLQSILDDGVNSEIPAEDHDAHIAFAAHGKNILENHIEEISSDLRKWDDVDVREYILCQLKFDLCGEDNPFVYIASRDSEHRHIYRVSPHGRLKGDRDKEIMGKITKVDFHPGNGGEITVQDRIGHYWLVAPIIDRDNNYQTVFSLSEA